MFESSVISYGSEANGLLVSTWPEFESSVISYGSEAISHAHSVPLSLRVV